jgi:hypothetical protein
MTCLLGNTETRTVFRNFELNNLHINQSDRSHTLYNRYLCYNRFLPPEETRYFAHLATNTLAPDPGNTGTQKGAFNVFPLNLATDELRKATSSSLGNELRFSLSLSVLIMFMCHRCGDYLTAQIGTAI